MVHKGVFDEDTEQRITVLLDSSDVVVERLSHALCSEDSGDEFQRVCKEVLCESDHVSPELHRGRSGSRRRPGLRISAADINVTQAEQRHVLEPQSRRKAKDQEANADFGSRSSKSKRASCPVVPHGSKKLFDLTQFKQKPAVPEKVSEE